MQSLKVNSFLILTVLLWASAFIGIKIGLVAYSPGALALLRFLVASLCMGVMYFTQKSKPSIPWKDKIGLILGGMAGIGVYNMCLNFGEITVTAGVASFIIGLMPVITIVLSITFFKEQISAGVWAGILVSLLGLMVLTLGEEVDRDMFMGIILVFISACTGAVLTLIQKYYVRDYSPIASMAWIIWGGTLMLLVFLPDLSREILVADFQSSAATVYLGIFPAAIAYVSWSYVLQYLAASKASLSLNAMPIASTIMGYILLEEAPSKLSLIGGSMALLGTMIANKYQEQPSISVPDEGIAA